VDCDLGYAMASLPQSRDRLENRRSEDDEMSRGMWEIVETSARKIRVGKAKEERSKRRSGEKEGREGEEEETEKEKDNGGEEGNRGMGNIG